jgi:hypothetical protein
MSHAANLADVKGDPQHFLDAERMAYWEKRGPKIAAFLLVIPGATIVGLGIGMLGAQVVPGSIIGFGAGLLIWGLIVALTD